MQKPRRGVVGAGDSLDTQSRNTDLGLNEMQRHHQRGSPRYFVPLEQSSRGQRKPAPIVSAPSARRTRACDDDATARTGESVAKTHVSEIPSGIRVGPEPTVELAQITWIVKSRNGRTAMNFPGLKRFFERFAKLLCGVSPVIQILNFGMVGCSKVGDHTIHLSAKRLLEWDNWRRLSVATLSHFRTGVGQLWEESRGSVQRPCSNCIVGSLNSVGSRAVSQIFWRGFGVSRSRKSVSYAN